MARDEWHGGSRSGPDPRIREDARADARCQGGGGGGGGAEERARAGSGREKIFAGGFRGGGQPNARQLTSTINNCRAVGQLGRILHEQRGSLNQIHVSAAWVCLVRIGGGRGGGEVREAVAALQDHTRDVLGQAGGRQLVNVLFSMAKIKKWGERVDQKLLEGMQMRATATAGDFNPQE
ncbi:hypothetical protein T484DRAFT_1794354, partial [Baffinella frigidus]